MNSNKLHIGLFYVIDGKIYKSYFALRDIKADFLGFKNYPKSHYECWNHICIAASVQNSRDYDFYPRGRIAYNIEDDIFFVWIDKCINNPKYHNLIVDIFGLTEKHVVFEIDELYQCEKCSQT